jgi:N6-adenosine-specific RNA methylase IME4
MTWEGLSPPYRTIVADPPWPRSLGMVRGNGRRWAGTGGRRRRATSMAYSTTTPDDIAAFPVIDLVDDRDQGTHMYLWVTAPLNREGVGAAVARAWGFKVVGEIVWRKPNFGLGAFPRPQHEVLLVCRRGSLPFARKDVGSVCDWPLVRAPNNGGRVHSAKPPAAYDLIESCSPGPYVELFCRQPRFGWDSWGHGYENFAEARL